jgi:hypothetical protein
MELLLVGVGGFIGRELIKTAGIYCFPVSLDHSKFGSW